MGFLNIGAFSKRGHFDRTKYQRPLGADQMSPWQFVQDQMPCKAVHICLASMPYHGPIDKEHLYFFCLKTLNYFVLEIHIFIIICLELFSFYSFFLEHFTYSIVSGIFFQI